MTFGRSAGLSCARNQQEDLMPQTRTRITQVGTVIVPVSDQQRALDFYVGTLGFEKRLDVPMGEDMRWIEVAPQGAITTIAVVPPREGDPVGVETRIALNTPDIEADHADLKGRGVDVDQDISRMGDPVPPMFWMRDPDGNILLVVETAG
jgi:catechol 2,3-dioxygenase-like lactoylglutathione lyase family enzyme